jgi:hypothetical protein
MHIRLHKNARTTPTICTGIAASSGSMVTLTASYHVGPGTIRHWRKCKVFTDASRTAHHLQTTLNSTQEIIVAQPAAAAGRSAGRHARISLRQSLALRAGSLSVLPRCGQPSEHCCPSSRNGWPVASSPINRTVCMWSSSICRRCPMKLSAAICLWS